MTVKSEGPIEQIDRASLMERVEGDRELLVEIVHLFQQDVPNLVAAMGEALQRGDMRLLERSAHSLKGAASNISAKPAATAALRLEEDAKNKDAAAAKSSLLEVQRAVKALLPALAEICQELTK